MSLVKRTYIDGETVITADNLNDIQDAIIENEEAIEDVETDITGLQADISGKVNINQGASNVGKTLKVNALGNLELANAGGAEIALIVKGKAGQSVTATDGTTTLSGTIASSGEYEFSVPNLGLWTVTSNNVTRKVDITFYGRYTVNCQATVFGIKHLRGDANTVWQRTDDSVGYTFSASIGTFAGQSSFDGKPIYKDIVREIINGDTLVKLPKFWYKRYIDGDNYEHIQIADAEADGFSIHPAFTHNNAVQDYIYVGAYKLTSGATSKANLAPYVSKTRRTFANEAAARGNGYGIIDLTTWSAIQMLMLVETADTNVQSCIGEGYSASNHSAAINTGSCEAVPNLTGRPTGTSNNVDVIWRGIEGFWGNVWEWVDGFNFNNGAYYFCNSQNNYKDDSATDYTLIGFNGATNWSASYITQEGLDANNPWCTLPSAAGSGSATTYYADGCWSSTGWRVAEHGGRWADGSFCGLFALHVGYGSSGAGTYSGSRLLYIP